jgi:hypothetical protein
MQALAGTHKRETPLVAGFRQSGSAYLPPGQTSCEAGVHRAGFCAPACSVDPRGLAEQGPLNLFFARCRLELFALVTALAQSGHAFGHTMYYPSCE